ncbi:hypothetical protein [Anaerotignum neopropionicum]|nr:hypothetical protein [Anaerotignum neopropionicum]
MLTSKEQTFPTTGIAGGFVKLKRTMKKPSKKLDFFNSQTIP